jgi:hypothetical protein
VRNQVSPKRRIIFGETRNLAPNLRQRYGAICSLYKLNDCISDAAYLLL